MRTDRFGPSSEIIPKQLDELMTDDDPAVVRRVTETTMKMVGIDVAALEAAARNYPHTG